MPKKLKVDQEKIDQKSSTPKLKKIEKPELVQPKKATGDKKSDLKISASTLALIKKAKDS